MKCRDDLCQDLCQLLQQSLSDGDVQCLEDLRQVLISIFESPTKPNDLFRLIIVQYYIQYFPGIPKALEVKAELVKKDSPQMTKGERREDPYRRQAREGVKQLGLCFLGSPRDDRDTLKERYRTLVPRDARVINILPNKSSKERKRVPCFIPQEHVENRIRATCGKVASSAYFCAANQYSFYMNLEDDGDAEDRFHYDMRVQSANELIRILGRDLAIGKIDGLFELKSVVETLVAPGPVMSCQRSHIIECFDAKFPDLPTTGGVLEFLQDRSISGSADCRREVQRFVSSLGLCFDGSPAEEKEQVLEYYRERVRKMLRYSQIGCYQHASAVCEEQIQLVPHAERLGIIEEMSKELGVDLWAWWRQHYIPTSDGSEEVE